MFALDAKAQLPPTAPPDRTVDVVDDPSIEIKEANVATGHTLFQANCMLCHGFDAVSGGGTAPDLRESRLAIHPEALKMLLRQGPLLPRGMPLFDNLTDEQIIQIHAYIRARAREALGTHQPADDIKSASGRF